jgi:hypothetical protein
MSWKHVPKRQLETANPIRGTESDAAGAPIIPAGSPSLVGTEHIRGWKLVVVDDSATPAKGSTFDNVGGQEEAQTLLRQALTTHALPTEAGEERKADPKEFKYKGREKNADGETLRAHFQHKDTRNYLYLDVENQQVQIPQGDKHFYRGVYDRSEHSDVYARMRRLSGIE